MPKYPEGFNEARYDELRDIVTELGSDRPFTVNDLLAKYMQHRAASRGGTVEGYNIAPVNAGSVAQILDDLADLEVLRKLDGNPPRWTLA